MIQCTCKSESELCSKFYFNNTFPRAPTDCVQYFTGVEGYVQSYGFGSGQLLSSQNYNACIRQEEGYCGIEWHPSSRTSPDSFGLLHAGGAGQGENIIDTYEGSLTNIPSAIGHPGATGLFHGICGEGWAKDGTTAALGPIRCKISNIRLTTLY